MSKPVPKLALAFSATLPRTVLGDTRRICAEAPPVTPAPGDSGAVKHRMGRPGGVVGVEVSASMICRHQAILYHPQSLPFFAEHHRLNAGIDDGRKWELGVSWAGAAADEGMFVRFPVAMDLIR
jgi:hypothetical protein